MIGTIGIICACLLLSGLKKKKTGKILWWLVFQGISIFHQVFFSMEIIAIVDHNTKNAILAFFVAMVLLAYVMLQLYFVKFIVGIYQNIVEEEIATTIPRSTWRVPTISELLEDECGMGQSPPPYDAFWFNKNRVWSSAENHQPKLRLAKNHFNSES